MHKLLVSALAEADLLDIWIYTAQRWNTTQADTYLHDIQSSLDLLLEHPKIGKDRADIKNGYRALHVNHHLVFYLPEGNNIQVIRVIHESSDSASHL